MATPASRDTMKAKTLHFFAAHGRFCASHPWEMIVTTVTLTVCILSMSVLSEGKVATVCGVNKPCEAKSADEETADTVLLSIVNSLAVIYMYKQFSSLRKAGSKYLLGFAGLFTMFSSFVFGSGVVNLIDEKVSGLHEALPFFVLLIDLSRASALAKFAFHSRNKEEVRQNIGRGMGVLGPMMTLDTLVEVLLIGIGTMSGVRRLEMISYFGCMSILASYLVFMTFFPASLALVLEVCPYDPTKPAWQLDELARAMQEEERKPNPVVQRVKIIMAMGLTVVHLHSRFLSGVTGLSLRLGSQLEEGGALLGGAREQVGEDEIEKVPLTEYLWWKTFNLSVDQLITLILATVLFIKYIFFDKSDTFATSVPPTPAHSRRPSLSCPFNLSDISEFSLVRRRRGSLLGVAVPEHGSGWRSMETEQLRRLLEQETTGVCANGGVPHQSPATSGQESSRPALPTLLRRSGTDAAAVSEPRSDSIKSLSSLMRAPSSTSLKDLSSASERPPSPEPPGRSSTGTQTDLAFGEDRPVFVVGDRRSAPTETGVEPVPRQEAAPQTPPPPRPLEECLLLFKSESGAASLTDEEILQLVKAKHIPAYKLEGAVGDPARGVVVRRKLISEQVAASSSLDDLPHTGYDYSRVMGACCENVVGYMPVPVGVAGPLLVDGTPYFIPMATTEGCLVASTNRGCRAVATTGGVRTYVVDDGMTRGPVVRFPSAAGASELKLWLDDQGNFSLLEEAFNSTSQFAKLKSLKAAVAGRLVYIRFKATTGDAMGMNMLSKGVERSLDFVRSKFPRMEVISLSGNFCTDKKPAAINWVDGRGKSVVCEATIPAQVVKQVLKTHVEALVDLNISKNLVGSAMAGALGGFNAHAANIISAIFIATGQDPAQNIASSNCITLLERSGPSGEDLHISCTMPSIEIGTVGGGTMLPPQAACLKMLGVHGPNHANPGENAARLARIACATVLAGELSLLSALAAGHLVKSHLTHNRSTLNLASVPEDLPAPGSESPKRTAAAPVATCTSLAS